MTKSSKNYKIENKKVLLIAQELKLARVLAGNNKNARDKALKCLKKWFQNRSENLPFTEDDFLRIWKGLFYTMWMSDKPLIQEECAENISKLIHFAKFDSSMLFFKCGLQILINEWFGIDQLRLDKFLMLVRRFLRQALYVLKNHNWNKKCIQSFGLVLTQTILSCENEPPLGLFIHFTEIFLEELAKVSNGHLHPDKVTDFLRPFIKKFASSRDTRQTKNLRKNIFTYLIRQHDLGLEYQEKYEAWKLLGFPGSIDSMQKVESDSEEEEDDDSSEEENEEEEGEEEEDDLEEEEEEEEPEMDVKDKPLDPRAGRVDVELAQIKFSPKCLAKALLEVKFDKSTTTKSRKLLTIVAEQFTKLANGIYPYGIKRVQLPKNDGYDTSIRKAVNRLNKFDRKIMGKKDRKRKRSKDTRDTDEVVIKKKKKTVKNIESTIDSTSINGFDGDTLEDLVQKREKDVLNNLKKGFKTKSNEGVNKKKLKRKLKPENPVENIPNNPANTSEVESKINGSNNKDLGSFLEKKLKIAGSNGTLTPSQKNNDENSSKIAKSSSKSSLVNGKRRITPISVNTEDSTSKKNRANESNEENCSPKNVLNPVKLFETPEKKKQKQLFPQTEWDEPLQEGEYEICIPSKKYVSKLKKDAKKNKQDFHKVLTTNVEKLLGKNRLSKTPKSVVKNPFSPVGTPGSLKKVKINTKLNVSQEFHEHHKQILSSPGIPYDANKKPLKPLLKTPLAKRSPINPFYKQLDI